MTQANCGPASGLGYSRRPGPSRPRCRRRARPEPAEQLRHPLPHRASRPARSGRRGDRPASGGGRCSTVPPAATAGPRAGSATARQGGGVVRPRDAQQRLGLVEGRGKHRHGAEAEDGLVGREGRRVIRGGRRALGDRGEQEGRQLLGALDPEGVRRHRRRLVGEALTPPYRSGPGRNSRPTPAGGAGGAMGLRRDPQAPRPATQRKALYDA